jgi:hypothetical protein
MKKPPAPFGWYCSIAFLMMLATPHRINWKTDTLGTTAEFAGSFVGALLLVAAVGETVRAFRYRKHRKSN